MLHGSVVPTLEAGFHMIRYQSVGFSTDWFEKILGFTELGLFLRIVNTVVNVEK